MNDNPWAVDSIDSFTCPGLKCPECGFFTKEQSIFESHATKNHPLSSVFFDKFKRQGKNDTVNSDRFFNEDLSKESKSVESSTTTTNYGQWNWKETLDDMCPPNFCKYRKENRNMNKKINQNDENVTDDIILENSGKMSTEEAKTSQTSDLVKLNMCEVCEITYTTKGSLDRHIQTVHEGKKPFQCEICKTCFSKTNTLQKHIFTVHEGKKAYKCLICNDSFMFSASLKHHISMYHLVKVHEVKKPQESYTCHACFKSFTKGIQLQEHMKHHKIESDPTNNFIQKSETLNHENSLCETDLVKPLPLRSVHEVKKPQVSYTWTCQTCSINFRNEIRLEEHMKVHKVKPPPLTSVHDLKKPQESYTCLTCFRTFANDGSLEKHISKVHLGRNKPINKPQESYSCHHCFFCFPDEETLAKHDKGCKDKRSFQCIFCPCSYQSENDLKRHISSLHQNSHETSTDPIKDELIEMKPDVKSVLDIKTEVIEVDMERSENDSLIDSSHIKTEIIEVDMEKSENDNLIDSSNIKTEVIEVDIEKSENDSLIDSRNIKKEIVDLDMETSASGSLINTMSIKKEPNYIDIVTSDDKSLINLSEIKKEQFDDLVEPMETCENESGTGTIETVIDKYNIKKEIPDKLD